MQSLRSRKRAAKWRLAQIIKLEKGCLDCGYAEHAVALQFDHIDNNKKMNVSDMIRSDYGWNTILLEIQKCEVRCANCHAAITARRKRDLIAVPSLSDQSSGLVYDFPATAKDSADEVLQSLTAC